MRITRRGVFKLVAGALASAPAVMRRAPKFHFLRNFTLSEPGAVVVRQAPLYAYLFTNHGSVPVTLKGRDRDRIVDPGETVDVSGGEFIHEDGGRPGLHQV